VGFRKRRRDRGRGRLYADENRNFQEVFTLNGQSLVFVLAGGKVLVNGLLTVTGGDTNNLGLYVNGSGSTTVLSANIVTAGVDVLIDDAGFTAQLRQSLENAMKFGSQIVERTLYGRRPYLELIADGLCYLLLRIGVALSGKSDRY
jgi:hypothetical protein